MPNTKSAIKAARQNKRRRTSNLARTAKIKNAIKQLKKHTQAGKLDDAKKFLVEVYSQLDKAAKTGVIHQNKASRLKSRLAKLLTKSTK